MHKAFQGCGLTSSQSSNRPPHFDCSRDCCVRPNTTPPPEVGQLSRQAGYAPREGWILFGDCLQLSNNGGKRCWKEGTAKQVLIVQGSCCTRLNIVPPSSIGFRARLHWGEAALFGGWLLAEGPFLVEFVTFSLVHKLTIPLSETGFFSTSQYL